MYRDGLIVLFVVSCWIQSLGGAGLYRDGLIVLFDAVDVQSYRVGFNPWAEQDCLMRLIVTLYRVGSIVGRRRSTITKRRRHASNSKVEVLNCIVLD